MAREIGAAGFVAVDFAEGFAKAFAGFVDLGFRVADAAIEDSCDFVVFVAVKVVEQEHPLVTFGKAFDRGLKIDAVEHACQTHVGCADFELLS